MIEPRPEVVREIVSLKWRLGCSQAELHAAVDFFTPPRKGRPQAKIYGRLIWGMCALVWVYGRDRFTAAKQILSLADGPAAQRENQIRALVRRFDECFKESELRASREFYDRQGPLERTDYFYIYWGLSGLPWPLDIKSATERETELQELVKAPEQKSLTEAAG